MNLRKDHYLENSRPKALLEVVFADLSCCIRARVASASACWLAERRGEGFSGTVVGGHLAVSLSCTVLGR